MKKIIFSSLFCLCVSLGAQTVNIDFGSTFDGDSFDALFFADNNNVRFDDAGVTNVGLLTVGYFSNIGAQSSFSGYLNDFTQVGSESAFTVGSSDGYLTAATSASSVPSSTQPYVLLLGGVSDFANALSASSFAIYSDTSWDDFPAPATPASTLNLLTLSPDTIVVGNFVSVADGFELRATATAIPEPATYTALAGFFALGWVMLRRRRA